MEITWGFLLLFTVFVFPGLIIRRLYFFGEFSKQFGYNDPLLKTLAYALVPGLMNAILTILLYDGFFGAIDLGRIFDAYKDMANVAYRHASATGTSVDDHFRNEVLPFLGLLYMLAFITGAISGQAVRWTGIDTKLKLFRFKNQWFYLFTGNHRRLRKYQAHVKDTNRFLFLKVDVLIEAGGGLKLYSGTLVDYELDADNCRELSKVVLKEAHRYADNGQGKLTPKLIPGNLLVVDCSKLVNINLTHVYETDQQRHSRAQAFRRSWINWIVVLTMLILPLMFFRIDAIQWAWYDKMMNMTWLGKLFAWAFVSQIIQLPNPIVVDRKTKEYRTATVREWILKIVMLPILYLVALGVDDLSKWFLSLFA
jgi:hypothetical protein